MNYITVTDLERYLKAMTILDIIIEQKENAWLRLINRYAIDKGHKYVVNNGSGDNLTIFITKDGALLKGFDHENELNQFAAEEWDNAFFEQVYANAPAEFLCLFENEDEQDETTFCMWCTNKTNEWTQNVIVGNDGGQAYLLGYVHKTANEWFEWAKDYYDINPSIDNINAIYNAEPVTKEIIKTINPDRDVAEALQEIHELG